MERTIAPDTLKALLRTGAPPVLPDVRRPDDRAKEPAGIPVAIWQYPSAVADWVPSLSDSGQPLLAKQDLVVPRDPAGGVLFPGKKSCRAPSRWKSVCGGHTVVLSDDIEVV